jgi:N-acetylglucosamine repressor
VPIRGILASVDLYTEAAAIKNLGLSHIGNAERNKRVILNALRDKGRLSRVELSQASKLSIATTKRLVDELMAEGLVMEGAAEEHSGRGRKPTHLMLDGRHGYAIGISIEPRALELRAIDFAGSGLFQQRLDPGTAGREALMTLAAESLRDAIAACTTAGRGPLLGVGAGIAGLVNTREGIVLGCPGLPGWENVDFGAFLREVSGVDGVVDDAVRCMALAEKRYGAARDVDTFLFVYIGSGVGAGIVLDNRIYRGVHGVSGEFGHITIRENGPVCNCGNRGCLEALVSTSAIIARVREALAANVYSALRADADADAERALTLAMVCSAAMAGDKLANMVIAEAEENIGIGVANLINVFDPGNVILAGEVILSFEKLILEGTQRIVGRRALHSIAHRTAIKRSAFDADTAALGAATLVIERALQNEILNL